MHRDVYRLCCSLMCDQTASGRKLGKLEDCSAGKGKGQQGRTQYVYGCRRCEKKKLKKYKVKIVRLNYLSPTVLKKKRKKSLPAAMLSML